MNEWLVIVYHTVLGSWLIIVLYVSAEDHPMIVEDTIYDKSLKEEPIYVNVNTKKLTNPVKVEDLKEFIAKAKENESAIMKAEHGVMFCYIKHIFCHEMVTILINLMKS